MIEAFGKLYSKLTLPWDLLKAPLYFDLHYEYDKMIVLQSIAFNSGCSRCFVVIFLVWCEKEMLCRLTGSLCISKGVIQK